MRREKTGQRQSRAGGTACTPLHEARLDAVMDIVRTRAVETVLDIGCGTGALLERLLEEPRLRRVVGVDPCLEALASAEDRLTRGGGATGPRLSLRQGCATALDDDLAGFDVHVLLEVVEHLPPDRLSTLERCVFQRLHPPHVLITTPNREYNDLLGLARGERRTSQHRFEWGRLRFQAWAVGVARRNRYDVSFRGIGPGNAWFGHPTQMAWFLA